MSWRDRGLAVSAWLAALAAPAQAADAGRLDLLAAEAARLTTAPGAAHASPAPWIWVAALVAGSMLAAFAGTYAGSRRQLIRGGKDWSELTYRFRSGKPLRLSQDALARLNGLLGDLQEIGTDPREVGGNPPVPAAAAPIAPSAPPRGDRPGDYERAQRLLEKGHDAATIHELTGIKAAELDRLRVAPAEAGR